MHVDGGATQQVFAIPAAISLNKVAQRDRTFYVIRNSRLSVAWEQVDRSVPAIAQRAISSLIHNQGVGDMYQIAAIAKRDGARFRLAYIPDSFTLPAPDDFDRDYMNALFLVGYKLGRDGDPWVTQPPGFADE